VFFDDRIHTSTASKVSKMKKLLLATAISTASMTALAADYGRHDPRNIGTSIGASTELGTYGDTNVEMTAAVSDNIMVYVDYDFKGEKLTDYEKHTGYGLGAVFVSNNTILSYDYNHNKDNNKGGYREEAKTNMSSIGITQMIDITKNFALYAGLSYSDAKTRESKDTMSSDGGWGPDSEDSTYNPICGPDSECDTGRMKNSHRTRVIEGEIGLVMGAQYGLYGTAGVSMGHDARSMRATSGANMEVGYNTRNGIQLGVAVEHNDGHDATFDNGTESSLFARYWF
jgi:hypothetical protein